jgi:hypothetical protein
MANVPPIVESPPSNSLSLVESVVLRCSPGIHHNVQCGSVALCEVLHLHLSPCQKVIFVPIYLFMSVCLPVCLSVCLSIYLSIYVCLSVCPSVYLSIYLSCRLTVTISTALFRSKLYSHAALNPESFLVRRMFIPRVTSPQRWLWSPFRRYHWCKLEWLGILFSCKRLLPLFIMYFLTV